MGRCLRNRLEMRQFPVFAYPEEGGLAPSWPAGVAREGKDEKTAPTEAVGCMLAGGREGKMEILVDLLKGWYRSILNAEIKVRMVGDDPKPLV